MPTEKEKLKDRLDAMKEMIDEAESVEHFRENQRRPTEEYQDPENPSQLKHEPGDELFVTLSFSLKDGDDS